MELTMTNKTITPTKCVKFLGVLIDEKLKWDEHIKSKTLSKKKKSRHIILFFSLPLFNIWNNTVGSNL